MNLKLIEIKLEKYREELKYIANCCPSYAKFEGPVIYRRIDTINEHKIAEIKTSRLIISNKGLMFIELTIWYLKQLFNIFEEMRSLLEMKYFIRNTHSNWMIICYLILRLCNISNLLQMIISRRSTHSNFKIDNMVMIIQQSRKNINLLTNIRNHLEKLIKNTEYIYSYGNPPKWCEKYYEDAAIRTYGNQDKLYSYPIKRKL